MDQQNKKYSIPVSIELTSGLFVEYLSPIVIIATSTKNQFHTFMFQDSHNTKVSQNVRIVLFFVLVQRCVVMYGSIF